jgi:farnesyl-diphosphate farnesyltransferase
VYFLCVCHSFVIAPCPAHPGIGYKDEKTLLQKFQHVTIVHQSLKPAYQAVISEICERMAGGMCDFAERKVRTIADYNLYCHYVAGLVGIGLSRIFSISGLESPQVAADEHTSNSMGLFLQKTNIIRDYLEDLVDERPWWPHEIWYARALSHPKNSKQSRIRIFPCLQICRISPLDSLPDHVGLFVSLFLHPHRLLALV